ncbi:MAG: YjhX family toxin [Candidatus Devosia euplotis]|nr:YjhX family toxin [Candidatus Devosia euplotis]
MDISIDEQRVLHALAQGGCIALIRNDARKTTGLQFFNREGWLTSNCTLLLFKKLKAKKAVKSTSGQPYRITRRGLELVRSQTDNRQPESNP